MAKKEPPKVRNSWTNETLKDALYNDLLVPVPAVRKDLEFLLENQRQAAKQGRDKVELPPMILQHVGCSRAQWATMKVTYDAVDPENSTFECTHYEVTPSWVQKGCCKEFKWHEVKKMSADKLASTFTCAPIPPEKPGDYPVKLEEVSDGAGGKFTRSRYMNKQEWRAEIARVFTTEVRRRGYWKAPG